MIVSRAAVWALTEQGDVIGLTSYDCAQPYEESASIAESVGNFVHFA